MAEWDKERFSLEGNGRRAVVRYMESGPAILRWGQGAWGRASGVPLYCETFDRGRELAERWVKEGLDA
jgi:hypothetical protein